MKIELSTVLLLPMVVSAQILFTEYYSEAEVDPRSFSMGKTSVISSNGSSAIFSNPSIIANLNGTQLQIGGRMKMGELGNANYTPQFSFNNLSASMTFLTKNSNLQVACGLGYRNYFDWGLNTDEDELNYSEDIQGGLNVISPSIAFGINEKYFFGFTFNKSLYSKIIRHGIYPTNRTKYSVDNSASFVQIGALYKMAKIVIIGASYRPEFEWRFINERYINSKYGIDTTMTDRYWVIPEMLRIGIKVSPSTKLQFVGEYQNRAFPENGSDWIIINQPRSENIDDGVAYRIGMEYQRGISYRIGYYKDDILGMDENDNEPNSMNGLTLGLGFSRNSIGIDIFSDYSYWSWINEVSLFDVNANERIDKVVKYTERFFRIGLAVKYTF